jgi:hypothetical protein
LGFSQLIRPSACCRVHSSGLPPPILDKGKTSLGTDCKAMDRMRFFRRWQPATERVIRLCCFGSSPIDLDDDEVVTNR